ncbi:hypothetical protein ABZW96_13915 [Nocardia sp. NPDC004168]|uniref:hypothetical protein n=1 Tax=Nocardia sp. NPDC004168 TaxID=3154452 RepID=UPI0033BD8CB6
MVESARPTNALNSVKQLEEDLRATRLAAQILDEPLSARKAVPVVAALTGQAIDIRTACRVLWIPEHRYRNHRTLAPASADFVTTCSPNDQGHQRRVEQMLRRASYRYRTHHRMSIKAGTGQVHTTMILWFKASRKRYSNQDVVTPILGSAISPSPRKPVAVHRHHRKSHTRGKGVLLRGAQHLLPAHRRLGHRPPATASLVLSALDMTIATRSTDLNRPGGECRVNGSGSLPVVPGLCEQDAVPK